MDLCRRIAAAIQQGLGLSNLPARWIRVTPEDRFSLLAGGTIDIECGSTTNTLSRQQLVDFTHTTFVDGAGLLVTAASGIKGVADLGRRGVAVIAGTTTEQALADALKKCNVSARVINVLDHGEARAAMERGFVEAYASDRIVLMGLLSEAKDRSKLQLTDDYLSHEHYALMVRRGDAAFHLAANRVLSSLYRSGEIVSIYKKWFGAMGEPNSLLKAMYLLEGLPD